MQKRRNEKLAKARLLCRGVVVQTDARLDDGTRSPVRWSQWNARAERYQGELDRKDAVGSRFIELLKGGNSPQRLRKRLPEMNHLLQAIFAAFAPQ